MLPVILFHSKESVPWVLGTPNSKTPGVDLEPPLLLSARGSGQGHSPRLRSRAHCPHLSPARSGPRATARTIY